MDRLIYKPLPSTPPLLTHVHLVTCWTDHSREPAKRVAVGVVILPPVIVSIPNYFGVSLKSEIIFKMCYFLYSAIDCGQLSAPDFGAINVTSTTFGSTASYVCNTGYRLVGAGSIRTCTATGDWSPAAPTCQSKMIIVYILWPTFTEINTLQNIVMYNCNITIMSVFHFTTLFFHCTCSSCGLRCSSRPSKWNGLFQQWNNLWFSSWVQLWHFLWSARWRWHQSLLGRCNLEWNSTHLHMLVLHHAWPCRP